MRISHLITTILFHFSLSVWSQSVTFGPKSVLLENLDVENADDSVVAGDFDGDGDIDLAGVSSGNLLLFQNKGDFGFDTIDLPDGVFEKVRDVADMNADGVDDLITTEAYFALDSLQNFTRHELNLGDFRLVRMARDINLDGFADIIGEFNEPGEDPIMYWYRNEAGTGFTERLIDSQESSYDYATVSDYNMDGRMDIIIVNSENNRFLIFRQGANGNFARLVVNVSTEVLDKGIGLMDVDNDTDIDIVSGAPLDFEESLYYLENKSLSFLTRHPIEGLLYINSLETGDLDGDGDEDLVFIDRAGGYRIGYIVNQGIDNWSTPTFLDSYSSFGSFAYQNINLFDTWLHLKDMDLDGKKDIVVSAIPDDEVYWFRNETIFTGTRTLIHSPLVFYPQPASDFIHVENLPFGNGVLTVFDSYGSKHMETDIQNQDVIHLSNLPGGLYYYHISNPGFNGVLSGKILKMMP